MQMSASTCLSDLTQHWTQHGTKIVQQLRQNDTLERFVLSLEALDPRTP